MNHITGGSTVNLIAVDVERLIELTIILASLWANPLIVVGCVYFLWQQLGAASLSGLAVLIVFQDLLLYNNE